MDERYEGPLMLTLLILLGSTLIASLISGKTGPMSEAYKSNYLINKNLYYAFSGAVLAYFGIDTLHSSIPQELLWPTWVTDVLLVVALALIVVFGIGWIATEVLRRDFPWGIFRVVQRGVSLLFTSFAVFLFLPAIVPFIVDNKTVRLISLYFVLPLFSIWGLWQLVGFLYSLTLTIFIPNKEKREAFIREGERLAAEEREREEKKHREWNNSVPTDIFGNTYKVEKPGGSVVELRKTSSGDYIDKDGNRYRKGYRDYVTGRPTMEKTHSSEDN